jgi:hypothetical protein
MREPRASPSRPAVARDPRRALEDRHDLQAAATGVAVDRAGERSDLEPELAHRERASVQLPVPADRNGVGIGPQRPQRLLRVQRPSRYGRPAPVRDTERQVGRLLDLVHEGARADRVERAGLDQERAAGDGRPNRAFVAAQRARGDRGPQPLLGQVRPRPRDELGARVGVQHEPRLGLAQRPRPVQLLGELVRRMDLQRQPLRGVDELDDEREAGAEQPEAGLTHEGGTGGGGDRVQAGQLAGDRLDQRVRARQPQLAHVIGRVTQAMARPRPDAGGWDRSQREPGGDRRDHRFRERGPGHAAGSSCSRGRPPLYGSRNRERPDLQDRGVRGVGCPCA